MAGDDLKLLQGTLDLMILQALLGGSMHGYGVAQWIRETTDDALQIEDGALYHALHRMERRRWLEADWGVSENNRRAKFYSLTGGGRQALERNTRSWRAYSEAVAKVLARQPDPVDA